MASDFDKFFDTIYSMLQSGEHILRQTARKLENESLPNKILNFDENFNDKFSEFHKFFFKETKKSPDFLTVVYPDAFCKAIQLTQENKSDVFDWLYQHLGTDNTVATDSSDDGFVLKWENTTNGNTIAYTAKIGDYIIERFDGWEYEVYAKTSDDFDRNLIIIKD